MRGTSRRGYTIFELLVVLAILIILGAAITLTYDGYYSNTRQKAAADGIRTRLADARTRAMESGTWYRLAIHEDRTRIRLAPDGVNFASLVPDEPNAPNARVLEDKFEEGVTAEVILDTDDPQAHDAAGWITIATVGPEGACREDGVLIRVREKDFAPIDIRVRGVIGTAKVVRPDQQQSGSRP